MITENKPESVSSPDWSRYKSFLKYWGQKDEIKGNLSFDEYVKVRDSSGNPELKKLRQLYNEFIAYWSRRDTGLAALPFDEWRKNRGNRERLEDFKTYIIPEDETEEIIPDEIEQDGTLIKRDSRTVLIISGTLKRTIRHKTESDAIQTFKKESYLIGASL